MKEIYGKLIPETLEELIEPRTTAVINIDLQNDCCSKGGQQDRVGLDISASHAILPAVARLSEAARRAGALVIHTQNLSLPDHRSDSPAWLRFKMRTYLPEGESDYSPEGTWGADFADEVKPQPGDIVVKKHRSDCFQGTNLDLVLRSNGIKTVVITGVVTQGCVESTARSAAFHDYFVVIPRDCVATSKPDLHEASLKVMEYRFDVVSSLDIIRAWRGARVGVQASLSPG
ncbi:MAG: cysteine hydrolase [Chloroflexi bacterium]|nr:cysteine hydrolase [Chloroflexota bacterium]